MSCLERCPYFRGVLIEGFHYSGVTNYTSCTMERRLDTVDPVIRLSLFQGFKSIHVQQWYCPHCGLDVFHCVSLGLIVIHLSSQSSLIAYLK